jgi:hypothetical protein
LFLEDDMSRPVLFALLTSAFLCGAALADDKKGKGKEAPQDDAVDAFFDPPPAKSKGLDELHKATEGVEHKDKSGKGMAPKSVVVDNEAPIQLHGAFAATKVVQDKKLGCQPANREKQKLSFFAFNELPERGEPFEVCLTMSSKAGREMSMSVSIVDPRNLRVAKGEDVVNFRGRTGRVDHVLEFPAPVFKMAGQYQYVVELDGKEVGRLPLFEVKIDPNG